MTTSNSTLPAAVGAQVERGVRPRGAMYVLHPGMIQSMTDGQHHHVGAMALARLYGVSLSQCEIYEPAPWWPESYYRMAQERHKGMIVLAPRYDGNYSLPVA